MAALNRNAQATGCRSLEADGDGKAETCDSAFLASQGNGACPLLLPHHSLQDELPSLGQQINSKFYKNVLLRILTSTS